MGYDRESQRWQRLPSLSFLPENFFVRSDWCQMEGALVLVFTWPDPEREEPVEASTVDGYNLYVANILTRTWKLLPPRPHKDEKSNRGQKWLIRVSLQAYKVVFFEDHHSDETYCCAQIYDSEQDEWSSSKKFDMSSESILFLSCTDWAYSDGLLYRLWGPIQVVRGIQAFNVQDGTFKMIHMPPIDVPIYRGNYHLSVWNDILLMLVYDSYFTAESVIVLEIDLQCQRWSAVTRGPPADLNFGEFHLEPVVGADGLLFVGVEVESGILSYHMLKDEWSCSPCPANVHPLPHYLENLYVSAPMEEYRWGKFSFQPGLNPFVAL